MSSVQLSGKASGRKTLEMPLNLGLKTKESYESWENLFKNTMAKDPLFPLTRTSENSIQWIHLLDPFDQQDLSKSSKKTSDDAGPKPSFETLSSSDSRGDSARTSSVKGSKGSSRGPQIFGGEKVPSLPEAVVALAQVAAKVSGESLFGVNTDFTDWSLIPSAKIQMLKCEKCSMVFYSPMNHRRHIRMIHRRLINTDKDDCSVQREQLAIFWDNLSPEVAWNIVKCNNLVLEDLTGDVLSKTLTSLFQQPGLFLLPLSYAKAGALLLELIHKKTPRTLPGSSELLKILDESSEKTFPFFACGSMHRYIFENGIRKVGLEIKNLVASLGFLVEQNLVKAWLNNKDAEALRCQMALVEEEEASLQKQAEIQERKRLKKVRQKAMRYKEKKHVVLDRQPFDGDSSNPGFSCSLSEITCTQLEESPQLTTSQNVFCRLTEDEGSLKDMHVKLGDEATMVCSGASLPSYLSPSLHEILDEDRSGSLEDDDRDTEKNTGAYNLKLSYTGGHAVDHKHKHSWRERRSPESNLSSSSDQSTTVQMEVHGNYRKSVRMSPSKTTQRAFVSAGHVTDHAMPSKWHLSSSVSHAVWTKKVHNSKDADDPVASDGMFHEEGGASPSANVHVKALPLENENNSDGLLTGSGRIFNSCNGSEAADVVCNSLVIGSLSVPLGVPQSELPTARSELGEVIVNDDAPSNKRHHNDVSEVTQQGTLRALHDNGECHLGYQKGFVKDNVAFKFEVQMDPECKENHDQPHDSLIEERPFWVAIRHSKYAQHKVWRPVSMPPSITTVADKPSLVDATILSGASDGQVLEQVNEYNELTTQHLDDVMAITQGQENEASDLTSISSCDEELALSLESKSDQLASGCGEYSGGVVLQNNTSEPIAVILSLRWRCAVNSTETVVYAELERQYQSFEPGKPIYTVDDHLWKHQSKAGHGGERYKGRDRMCQAPKAGLKYIQK